MKKTKICKFKAHDNIPWYEFCLESMSEDFTKDEMNEMIEIYYTVYTSQLIIVQLKKKIYLIFRNI